MCCHSESNSMSFEQPVVTNIDVTNTTLTVNVIGGTPDYQYSLDKIMAAF
jgi:hypothetical protein